MLATSLAVMLACNPKESARTEIMESHVDAVTGEVVISRAQFERSSMRIGTVQEQVFTHTVKANGYIDVPPERKASVSVKLGGFVKSLSILPGEKVKQGSVLFTLENPEYIQLQQEYLETRAQLRYMQSDYERQKTLASENIASQKNYLKAESDYHTAEAKLKGLKEKLRLLNINIMRLEEGVIEPVVNVYAPINGFITKVNITRGVYVAPTDAAVELVDTEHMHVELQVFEKDIAEIRKSQKINFHVVGANMNHTGEVFLVGKTIENDTRTVNIHGHIDDEDEITDLLPGMYVEASIDVASVQRPVLPSEAMVSLDNVSYVLVLLDETPDAFRFKRMEVTTGQFNNQWTEIINTASFPPDTKFLVKGAFNLVVE
jgi:membrane fusion protein, heavy metal efflux system